MMTVNGNKEFLYRIKFVLGDRSKHPWGDALGIKNTRIQNMFKGVIPQADALDVIYRAEKVRIEWLIGASDCPPFEIVSWLPDTEIFKQLSDPNKTLALITDNCGHVVATTTQGKTHEYVDNRDKVRSANFDEVTTYWPINPGLVSQIKLLNRDIVLVTTDETTMDDIAGGRKGPVHIRELIKSGARINSSNLSLVAQAEPDLSKLDKELFDKLQLLTDEQRAIMINLLRMLVTETDATQKPPILFIDPDYDLETENQPVTVESQTPPPDEIDPND